MPVSRLVPNANNIIAADALQFNPFADQSVKSPPSLTKRITSVFGDTLARASSFLGVATFLSPNRLLQSILYNLTPTACLNKIFSSLPTCCKSFQELINATKNLCPPKNISDVFTSKYSLGVLKSVFSNTSFKAAVISDALFHSIYGVAWIRKNELSDSAANIVSWLVSAAAIFHNASKTFEYPSNYAHLTASTKFSYKLNDLEFNFLTNVALNFGSFVLYRGGHYFITELCKFTLEQIGCKFNREGHNL